MDQYAALTSIDFNLGAGMYACMEWGAGGCMFLHRVALTPVLLSLQCRLGAGSGITPCCNGTLMPMLDFYTRRLGADSGIRDSVGIALRGAASGAWI